jgi:hypothetical protein
VRRVKALADLYVGLGGVYQYVNNRSISVYYVISGIYPKKCVFLLDL